MGEPEFAVTKAEFQEKAERRRMQFYEEHMRDVEDESSESDTESKQSIYQRPTVLE